MDVHFRIGEGTDDDEDPDLSIRIICDESLPITPTVEQIHYTMDFGQFPGMYFVGISYFGKEIVYEEIVN